MQLLISAGASLAATAFPFFCTCLGAVLVCALRPGSEDAAGHRAVQGFAAGVMLAASVFSLLLPAAELAAEAGIPGWLAACGGFLVGAGMFLGLDLFSAASDRGLSELAIALHILPAGMAAGLAAAAACLAGTGLWAGAGALALGVGIQNIPEGAAVSLPALRRTGSRWKALGAGVLSGAVEPVGGLAAALLAGLAAPALPWLLAFAAGAMVYAAVAELIPDACGHQHSLPGVTGTLLGFGLMMALDMGLG